MRKVIISLLVLISFNNIFSQDSTKFENLIKKNEILTAKIDSLNREINLRFKETDIRVKEEVYEVKAWGKFATFLGAIGILGLLISFFWMLPKMAKQKAAQYFDDHFNQKSNELLKTIKSQERESQIKNGKTILIVLDNNNLKQEAAKLVKAFDFQKVKTVNITDLKNINGYDMILFYNLNASKEKETITDCMNNISKNKEILFVAYTKTPYLKLDEADLQEKLNFANTQFSLYFRIIDCFIFQEVMNT